MMPIHLINLRSESALSYLTVHCVKEQISNQISNSGLSLPAQRFPYKNVLKHGKLPCTELGSSGAD